MTYHNLPDKDDAPWLDTTYDGFNEEAPNGDYIKSYPLINRMEVIGQNGREYVQYDCSNVQVSQQDRCK